MTTFIEHGPPEAMLSAYIIERGADLTVIGAFERGRLFHAIVQGYGPRIVDSAPNDVLVVRPARPVGPETAFDDPTRRRELAGEGA